MKTWIKKAVVALAAAASITTLLALPAAAETPATVDAPASVELPASALPEAGAFALPETGYLYWPFVDVDWWYVRYNPSYHESWQESPQGTNWNGHVLSGVRGTSPTSSFDYVRVRISCAYILNASVTTPVLGNWAMSGTSQTSKALCPFLYYMYGWSYEPSNNPWG